MKELLRLWWAFAVRATFALMLALILFFAQGFLREEFIELIALPFVVTALILYGIFDSLILLVMGSSMRHLQTLRKLFLLQGGSGIAASAVLAFFLFEKATVFWFVAIAFCQLAFIGALEMIAAAHLRRHLKLEVFLGSAGLASVLCALLLPFIAEETSFYLSYWLIGYGVIMFIALASTAVSMHRTAIHVHQLAH